MKAAVKMPAYNWEPYKEPAYPVVRMQFSTTKLAFRRLRHKRFWFNLKSIINEDTNPC